MGVTDAGELVFALSSFRESFYVLYFHPRRNSTREALLKGTYGEIRHCEFDSKSMHTIDVFPDHVKSIFSL